MAFCVTEGKAEIVSGFNIEHETSILI